MLKVLFTANIPVPYRTDFFNKLGEYVDLTVTYERKSAGTRNQEWLKNDFRNYKAIFLKGIRIGDDCACSIELVNIIKAGNFDRIIIGIYYSPTAIMATEYMRMCKIPFIFSGDGGFVKQENRFKRAIKNHLQSGAEVCFSPSKKGDEVLINAGYTTEQICRYSFTSVLDEDILKEVVTQKEKEELREQLGIKEQKIVIGVGRLLDWKGWDTLINVAKKLGLSTGIYIIGGNPIGTYYECYYNEQIENVHFVDFLQKTHLKKYYQMADVFVLPSHEEAWGLVINEAMANGLPVISTYQCTAASELIFDGENGYLFQAGDEETLCYYLNQILQDNVKRTTFGEKSLQIIRSYSIENMVHEYLNVLEEYTDEYICKN